MAHKMDWRRTRLEEKMRRQGNLPHEDILPRAPNGQRVSPKGNMIVSGSASKLRTNQEFGSRGPSPRTGAIHKGTNDLINFVADSVVAGHWLSDKVPRSVSRQLACDVDSAGGLLAWAEAHPNFRKLLKKKRQKASERPSEDGSGQKAGSPVARYRDDASDAKTRRKRIKHLQSEIAQAEEFIKVAREEIDRLQDSQNGGDGSQVNARC